MEFCSNGGYATSFKLRVEGDQGSGDDTALNSICLGCSHGDEICSNEGKWGNWGTAKNDDKKPEADTCKEGFFAAKYRMEMKQYGSDDTAGNDLYLYCKDKESTEFAAENGGPWGTWMPQRWCRSGHVICGIKTRVEEDQGYCSDCDDTSLNGMELQCCEDIWE